MKISPTAPPAGLQNQPSTHKASQSVKASLNIAKRDPPPSSSIEIVERNTNLSLNTGIALFLECFQPGQFYSLKLLCLVSYNISPSIIKNKHTLC